MTRMEALALVLSGISLVVAVVGTVLSNKRASEALAQSRKAATVALWSGVQEAVQRLIGFDPASEPIRRASRELPDRDDRAH
jgi:CHASE1-domain containing sensor protein